MAFALIKKFHLTILTQQVNLEMRFFKTYANSRNILELEKYLAFL